MSMSLRRSSALVTGGAGFIGSHLVDALVEAGLERVVVLDNLWLGRRENLAGALAHDSVELVEADCAELELLHEIAAEPFDYCFNLAVIPLPHSLEQPKENIDHNVAMTTAVCELGRAGRYRRLVQYSSSEVYGTARTAEMDETHEIRPHTPYAAAKAATDLIAESYGVTFGQEMALVRPFNTYGERQNSGSYAGLIPAVVTRVRSGEPVLIHGDGFQSRDLTYVRDQVEGVLAAVQCDEALGRWINVGSGREATVNEIVALILEAMGAPDHAIEHVPQRIGDVRRHLSDVSLARRLFGYQPRTDLAEGIARTVSWYVQTLE